VNVKRNFRAADSGSGAARSRPARHPWLQRAGSPASAWSPPRASPSGPARPPPASRSECGEARAQAERRHEWLEKNCSAGCQKSRPPIPPLDCLFSFFFVLARGELDKLEGPKYAARRAELRRKARGAARARDWQAAAPSQNETEESDATRGRSEKKENAKRVGRPRGGMKVAARIGERLRKEIGRGRRPRVGDGYCSTKGSRQSTPLLTSTSHHTRGSRRLQAGWNSGRGAQ